MTRSPTIANMKPTIDELIAASEEAASNLGDGSGRAALECFAHELKELKKRKGKQKRFARQKA